jgi:hypothetical protein
VPKLLFFVPEKVQGYRVFL